jgi:hypothetical protein
MVKQRSREYDRLTGTKRGNIMKNLIIRNFRQVFSNLAEGKIPLVTAGEPDENSLLPVVYKGIKFSILVPKAEALGNDTWGTVVYTGTPRNTVFGLKQTRRLAYVHLGNTGVHSLPYNSDEATVKSAISSGTWYITGFWNEYQQALIQAHAVASSMPRLSTEWVSSVFNKEVSSFLNGLELVKNDAMLQTHGRDVVLGYPGTDTSQSHGGAIMSRRFSPETIEFIRREFHLEALRLRMDIITTGKGHPGRRVAFKPKGYTQEDAQLGLWPSMVCQTRVPRELFTAIPNAVKYLNERGTTPKVVSDKGTPDFLKGYVKFTNCTFLSMEEVVELHNEKYINADQVLASGWNQIDGMFSSVGEETIEETYKPEESLDVAMLRLQEKYGEEALVSLNRKVVGEYQELSWNINRKVVQEDYKLWKAMTPDAVKGMVIPENALFVEKRADEDFVRPIYLMFASEAVEKKEAYRSILRMLHSRTTNSRVVVNSDTPRFEYQKEVSKVIERLPAGGKSKIYKLFLADRQEEMIDQLLKIPVLGFSEENGKVVPIDENSVGILHGGLQEIVDPDGNPIEVVVGELPILRMPESEDFGEMIRMKCHGNGISLDPFLILGKPDIKFPRDEEVETLLNFEAELYHLL